MTAVLLWKEYRQQRAVWLAIAFLALFLAICLAETLGQGNGLQVYQEERLSGLLNWLVRSLSVSFGIVSGALLLAGEIDDGTLVFLDTLTGRRGPLWTRKFLAGVLLTLSQSLVLAGLALGLGFGSWHTVILLPLLGLDALIWGLLGGALCRKVLTAVLTGIVFMALSWLLLLPFGNSDVQFGLAKGAAALAGGYVSWRSFSKTDRSRRLVSNRMRSPVFSTEYSLLWLVFSQGRWLLAVALAIALLLVGSAIAMPLFLWPIGSLLLGLICGLAVFTFDQKEGRQFLGAQRLPPGRVWTVKILAWGTILFGLTVLAWYVTILCLTTLNPVVTIFQPKSGEGGQWWFYVWMAPLRNSQPDNLDAFTFLGLWPLYGFCFGQFFGQVAPRPILAIILAAFITPLAVGLWIPSFLMGGLSVWQPLIVPLLLLLITRLVQWPWVSGRLWTGRSLAGIGGGVALMMLSFAGSLWYRVQEIPDVGEPFDVTAFTASLPSPEENEAGFLIRKACVEMRGHVEKVDAQPAAAALFPEGNIGTYYNFSYGLTNRLLQDVQEKGWPKEDKAIVHWLDQLFEGSWVKDAQKAIPLPLGMVQDPRLLADSDHVVLLFEDCRDLGALFLARTLQRQAQGNFRDALYHLDTALTLSRQMKNDAPGRLFLYAEEIEKMALSVFSLWLQKVGPDKELLRAALAILKRHEANRPDPANSIKAQFLVNRNNEPSPYRSERPPVRELLRTAYQTPWEKERQLRLFRVITWAYLRALEIPYWLRTKERKSLEASDNGFARWAAFLGLPPKEGPGANLSVWQWGQVIRECSLNDYGSGYYAYAGVYPGNLQTVHASQLVTALALYQVDHGKPPDQLDALIPTYLTAVPDDLITGQPFRYGISTGEILTNRFGAQIKPAPGQAFVGTEGTMTFYLVPVWTRKEDKP